MPPLPRQHLTTAASDCGGYWRSPKKTGPPVSSAVYLKTQVLGISRTGIEEGWIDQAAVDAMRGAIDAWVERPDAFSVLTYCEAIGWVSD
jgi:hypothetical protein